MKHAPCVALLAGVATFFAQVPTQAATHPLSVEDSTIFGGGDQFTSSASSPLALTAPRVPGLSSSSVAADNPPDIPASRGFRHNWFEGIWFTSSGLNLGGGGEDEREFKLLGASSFNPDSYPGPEAKSANDEHTTLALPELWTSAMIGLAFVGSILAARRKKSSISAFD